MDNLNVILIFIHSIDEETVKQLEDKLKANEEILMKNNEMLKKQQEQLNVLTEIAL